MKEVPNHNHRKWFSVAWLPPHQGKGHKAGWYVVRNYPCHQGEPVTLPFDTEEDAKIARQVIVTLRKPT